MKSTFEQMGGTYRQEGDYLLPNLELPDTPERPIGKYGLLRRSYLKNHRKSIYTAMFLNATLYQHLAEIDQSCNERMELLIRHMAEHEGVTEDLKASNQMAWVGQMNGIKNRAEEIILAELIYT